MAALRTMIAGASGAVLLAGLIGLAMPGTATAATPTFPNCGATGPCQDIGEAVAPSQPYSPRNPDASDWFGSFLINGQQSWCIDFALAAPDQHEQFTTGQTLLTKFGAPVDPTTAAEISFLLLRFGNTQVPDEAAALAWLLHMWTAAPDGTHTTDPSNTFATVAFDAPAAKAKMTASAQAEIATMQADALANHGPWTATMAAPSPLIIGTATNWSISVLGASGKGVGSVPVSITATDAKLPNGTATQVINTPADGSALSIAVTPTGTSPKLVATLDSPAAIPKVLVPAPTVPPTQVTVTTGGVTPVTKTTTGTAQNAPGSVTVTKTNADNNNPIAGAAIELTAADKTSPVLKQDGTKLTGTDGKPIVLTTGADGTAQVTGLQTPQAVCVIEVTPPPGFDQSFDPKSPPTACGTINPGATLQLTLTDVPNKTPIKIPAGGPPSTVSTEALVTNQPAPGALVGFGGLLVIGAAGGTLVARRLSRRRR
ncbi:MAG TPA: hypothetical protein VH333_17240 [Pseudonocardiaceae bacterium]|jgi:hypothetical protein|nr:hypothetical protein [Pseudonocardiaceae bacterium]